MIPKIIHYCWISDSKNYHLPEIVQECINSWKKNLPDYEIKEWNINNFDINKNDYIREAYKAKKYAFVSDYIRLYVLYNYGGIYMDTDVKALKSFNDLLRNNAFMGFESIDRIATCIIGSEKENKIIKEMLNLYDNKHFIKENGEYDLIPNTVLVKSILKKYDIIYNNVLQRKEVITIYPIEYFCPLNGMTGEMNITSNSYAIHLFNGSWLSQKEKTRLILYRKYYSKLKVVCPQNIADLVAKGLATYSIEGYKGVVYRFYKRFFLETKN